MVINKKVTKIQKLVEVLFAGTVLVEVLIVVFIISFQSITESSIIFSTYLPFSQLHIAGFQI